MTLIYDLPIKKGFGLEYCWTKVTASLGAVDTDPETGKEKYTRQIHPAPPGLSSRLPSDVAKLGHAWSPLKLYYRRFRSGPADKRWRLSLARTDRSEGATKDAQDVTLIITIRDLAMQANIHKELAEEMQELNWQFRNLKLRTRVRVR